MSTPRSRAIAFSRQVKSNPQDEERPIHITPADEDPRRNRVEHYGALGAILDQGVTTLLQDNDIITQLHQCSSPAQLRRHYTDALSLHVQKALIDTPYVHDELAHSQDSRSAIHQNIWRHVEETIDAGAQTAINTIEATYEILSRLFGHEAASHPANSSIIDKMAKLNIDHMTLYRDVYFERSDNQSHTRHHFIDQPQGGIKWAPGFPSEALIPIVLSKPGRIINREDLSLNQDCIPLKDVSTTFPETIGCPITFNPSSVNSLWVLYLECIKSLDHPPMSRAAQERLAFIALDSLTHPDDIAE